jgi:hypothetical protein
MAQDPSEPSRLLVERRILFELPEVITLASQMNATLTGKIVERGELGSRPHKFVWYNCEASDFETITRGKVVGPARGRG